MARHIECQFGAQLRHWRLARGKTQSDLAERSGYSQRHLSFLELGRSRPTRESAIVLAETLDLPLPARNALLLSAGYAPTYSAEPLGSALLGSAEQAFQQMLESSMPFPSMLVDRTWNVLAFNPNMQRLLSCFVHAPAVLGADVGLNALRLCLDRDGLKGRISNWHTYGRTFQKLLRRDLAYDPNNLALHELDTLLARDLEALPDSAAISQGGHAAMATLALEKESARVELFTMVSSVEEPNDATLSNLRVETFFPVDADSRRFLETLA